MDRQNVINHLKNHLPEMQSRFFVVGLSLFGSYARGEASPGSDVDILVDFRKTPDFDLYMDLKFYLEDLLGIPVDLVTEAAMRPRVRDAVQKELIHVA
jgi:uncharacterized protein